MKHLRLDNILSSGRSNRAVVNKNTRSYLVPTEILKPASTNPEKKSGQIQVRLDRVESGLALSFAHWSREKEQVATLNPSCIQNRQWWTRSDMSTPRLLCRLIWRWYRSSGTHFTLFNAKGRAAWNFLTAILTTAGQFLS
jgi:hypothetical protein